SVQWSRGRGAGNVEPHESRLFALDRVVQIVSLERVELAGACEQQTERPRPHSLVAVLGQSKEIRSWQRFRDRQRPQRAKPLARPSAGGCAPRRKGSLIPERAGPLPVSSPLLAPEAHAALCARTSRSARIAASPVPRRSSSTRRL